MGEGHLLPDRTRVEQSPFTGGPEESRRRGAVSDPTDKDMSRSARGQPSPPSIIVNETIDSSVVPMTSTRGPTSPRRPAASPSARVESEWDDPPLIPPEDDANATRVGVMPEARPKSDDPPEEPQGEGPIFTVEVLQGPDKGVRLPIRGGRMVVGRGDGCELKLTDTTVSRRHLELAVVDDGLLMRDLGSGNGTTVNGQRGVEVQAGHGDEIALGDTVLKVVDMRRKEEEEAQQAAKPEPSAPGRRHGSQAGRGEGSEEEPDGLDPSQATGIFNVNDVSAGRLALLPKPPKPPLHQRALAQFNSLSKVGRFAVIGAVAVVVLMLLFALIRPRPRIPPGSDQTPAGAPVIDPKAVAAKETEYEEARKDARRLFSERKYEKALERANDAMAAKKTTEVERLISTLVHNVEAAKTLQQGRDAAASGDFDTAIAKAKAVDSETDLADEAKELVKKWQEDKAKALVEQVRSTAKSGDFDAARSLLQKVPVADQEPLRKEIKEIEDQLKKDARKLEALRRLKLEEAKKAKEAQERAAVDEEIVPVVRKLESGDFDGAMRQVDRVGEATQNAQVVEKLKVLKKNIPGFGQAFNEGVAKFRASAFEQAAPALLKALTLLENMDINTKLEKPLKDKTAQALVEKGKSAAARQDYGTAARAFREAEKLNGGSREVKMGLDSIKRHAEEIYSEGYTLKERDPEAACKRFRDVIDMVPGDEWAKKAKGRLDELSCR